MEIVRNVMTTEIDCCTLLDNVYEVAVKMKNRDVGAIPIVDSEKIVGIITDRDIVIRGIAEKRPNSTSVKEIMTDELVTVTPDTSTEEAANIMSRYQIRRLPVVENGKLVGIVALGDLARRNQTDEQAGRALSEISEKDYNELQ